MRCATICKKYQVKNQNVKKTNKYGIRGVATGGVWGGVTPPPPPPPPKLKARGIFKKKKCWGDQKKTPPPPPPNQSGFATPLYGMID